MLALKTILLVEDDIVNRKLLAKILAAKYTVLEAENGQIALELLREYADEIVAIMLDLVMPVMDGYAVLQELKNDGGYRNLPIVVTTGDRNSDNEIKALTLGAWDFVSKPYNPDIIMFRLNNAIEKSQLSALKELKYLAEYDALTGIYNKNKFFAVTREMLDANPGQQFAFLRFDVDRFQLINSFFGAAEGDKLLIYIAEQMAVDAEKCVPATYGRIESDIVGLCVPYQQKELEAMVKQSKQTLALYNPDYDIVPSVGIYVIDEPTIAVEEMYNRATLAAKSCKGNYVDFYAYYNESMSKSLALEQEITNDMNFALANGQFQIYLQPKYNIQTNLPCGAEALVRWLHPQKGLRMPNEFIPVFERNGFITKLDYYVWEQACQCLHGWLAQGIVPEPLSVNVSRVNIYNPNLVENLLELLERYELEPALLNLELTESAYTDNPVTMKKVMAQLQSHGFTIMMDDFGSGYSSLAILKDIMIDILKIDMRFLSATEIPGRGENIVASVIRMAKWLNIPVIAEGAETARQVEFLRSVGCDYVQGYYFARPMPVLEYEQLCMQSALTKQIVTKQEQTYYSYNDLFTVNQEMKRLFSDALQAAAIYEFVGEKIEILRVNEAYYALLGSDAMLTKVPDLLNLIDEESREALLKAFRVCVATRGTAECEYMRRRVMGTPLWLHARLRYVSVAGNKHILIGELTDITMRKELDSELQKYREVLLTNRQETNTVLIVDDAAINRVILKKILQNRFTFLEAANGLEAIECLHDQQNNVDLILLDISMPLMDGKEFLQYKKKSPELDGIPVIMITADDSAQQQVSTFTLGANDYIVKPFIPEVVVRRVQNVLEANHRFKEMVREYNTMSEQVKTDLMTGLLNRVSTEVMISQRLANTKVPCVMLMLDIDNFKKINDTSGHDYGDKVICAVAEKLRQVFRKEDIIGRMGGDEFAIFIENMPKKFLLEKKAKQLCDSIASIELDGKHAGITCSVGAAVSSEEVPSFAALYQNTDKALYNAKCNGRNTAAIYGEAQVDSKWLTDAESVLAEINDFIYVCDKSTYELLYANDNVCKFAGVTQNECQGKKCYEVLMHKKAPCEFCSWSKMSVQQVYTRVFQSPNSGRVFLMRGKDLERNGALLHLEVAVDISTIEQDAKLKRGASSNV
ncbi:MAG: EAL domain-containing protein [Acidaminococcaceae bacterium]